VGEDIREGRRGDERKGSRSLLLRDGNRKGRGRGNEGRERRHEGRGRISKRKGGEKPARPIRNVPAPATAR